MPVITSLVMLEHQCCST
ncbi:MAG: hypothetical protein EXS25_03565 [Pedosphaera sp.]|nr:hypothetical protein [Pedosphaera sp.]